MQGNHKILRLYVLEALAVAKMVTSEGGMEKNCPELLSIRTVETFGIIEEQQREKKLTLISPPPLLKNHITVEPILFLYALASSISSVISSNFYIERICRVQLNYSSNYCQDLLIHGASAGSYNNINDKLHLVTFTIIALHWWLMEKV